MYTPTNFFYGGLNTDDNPNSVPKDEYVGASNIRYYGGISGMNNGVQSIRGNLIMAGASIPEGSVVVGAM